LSRRKMEYSPLVGILDCQSSDVLVNTKESVRVMDRPDSGRLCLADLREAQTHLHLERGQQVVATAVVPGCVQTCWKELRTES